jgi:hypothetical protein
MPGRTPRRRTAPRRTPRQLADYGCQGCGVCALCLLDRKQDAGRGLTTEQLHFERIDRLYAVAAANRTAPVAQMEDR